MDNDIEEYFSGNKLVGDDFSLEQLKEWFEGEKEGYSNLGAKDREKYQYHYHELNNLVSYKYIKNKYFKKVLGVGSAYGDELKPIISQIGDITILDPSDHFSVVKNIYNKPCKYIKPNVSGDLPFRSNSFDLIIAFGVFHHIPNVSYVIGECRRVLRNDGFMLIREPIVSMGDWRKPRYGLTRNERGIPYSLLVNIVSSHFLIKQSTLCGFPPLSKLLGMVGVSPYTSKVLTRMDVLLSMLFSWNINYHARKLIHKFRPASLALVLKKGL